MSYIIMRTNVTSDTVTIPGLSALAGKEVEIVVTEPSKPPMPDPVKAVADDEIDPALIEFFRKGLPSDYDFDALWDIAKP